MQGSVKYSIWDLMFVGFDSKTHPAYFRTIPIRIWRFLELRLMGRQMNKVLVSKDRLFVLLNGSTMIAAQFQCPN